VFDLRTYLTPEKDKNGIMIGDIVQVQLSNKTDTPLVQCVVISTRQRTCKLFNTIKPYYYVRPLNKQSGEDWPRTVQVAAGQITKFQPDTTARLRKEWRLEWCCRRLLCLGCTREEADAALARVTYADNTTWASIVRVAAEIVWPIVQKRKADQVASTAAAAAAAATAAAEAKAKSDAQQAAAAAQERAKQEAQKAIASAPSKPLSATARSFVPSTTVQERGSTTSSACSSATNSAVSSAASSANNSRRGSKQMDSTEWACASCTFVNSATRTRCGMCDHAQSASSAPVVSASMPSKDAAVHAEAPAWYLAAEQKRLAVAAQS